MAHNPPNFAHINTVWPPSENKKPKKKLCMAYKSKLDYSEIRAQASGRTFGVFKDQNGIN